MHPVCVGGHRIEFVTTGTKAKINFAQPAATSVVGNGVQVIRARQLQDELLWWQFRLASRRGTGSEIAGCFCRTEIPLREEAAGRSRPGWTTFL
jgi:hypothetical protein